MISFLGLNLSILNVNYIRVVKYDCGLHEFEMNVAIFVWFVFIPYYFDVYVNKTYKRFAVNTYIFVNTFIIYPVKSTNRKFTARVTRYLRT